MQSHLDQLRSEGWQMNSDSLYSSLQTSNGRLIAHCVNIWVVIRKLSSAHYKIYSMARRKKAIKIKGLETFIFYIVNLHEESSRT